MESFEFKLFNTIKVELETEQTPSDEEIIMFLRNAGVDLKLLEAFYKNFDGNGFFVKFGDTTVIIDVVDLIKNHNLMQIGGISYTTSSSLIEHFTTIVQLHNLPPEVPDEMVIKKLAKYDKIIDKSWQKIKIDDNIQVHNGTRLYKMHINKVIPPYLYVLGIKVRSYFKFQKEMCYLCSSISHHRSTCKYQELITDKIEETDVHNIISKISQPAQTEKKRKKKKPNKKKRDKDKKSKQDQDFTNTLATEEDSESCDDCITEERFKEVINSIHDEWKSGRIQTKQIIDKFKENLIPIDSYVVDEARKRIRIVAYGTIFDYNI